jgi:ribonuclease/clavin/mitogillin
MREEKVYAALPEGAGAPRTAEAMLPQAYDDTPVQLWPFALLSVQAHLAKLVEDGRATESDGRYARRC